MCSGRAWRWLATTTVRCVVADVETMRSAIHIVERREAEALAQRDTALAEVDRLRDEVALLHVDMGIALGRRDAAVAALRGLVEALPRCAKWVPGPQEYLHDRCGKPATHVNQLHSGPLYLCDEHRSSWPKLPWTTAVENARRVLDGAKEGATDNG